MMEDRRLTSEGRLAARTLAPGWRCDVCEYPLEGLPDRDEETQCPECGHIGRPVGAPPIASTGEMVVASFLSLGSLATACLALWAAWIVGKVDFSRQEMLMMRLPAIALAAALLLLAVVVWAVPTGRWRAARWLGCAGPLGLAAVALIGASFLTIVLVPFALVCIAWLISPELRWLYKGGKGGRLPR